MVLAVEAVHGKYAERPPVCPDCSGPCWWNGTREVGVVRQQDDGEGVSYEPDVVRRRACCSSKQCPRGGFTVYEKDGYPHRVFALEVTVAAVGSVLFMGSTLTAAGHAHRCSRDTVRRWVAWVQRLADPAELLRLCTRLEPHGLPGGLAGAGLCRAAWVLHLLDRLAELLTLRGVLLPAFAFGLVRIVVDQLRRFRAVFYLTRLSPPLRADWVGVCL